MRLFELLLRKPRKENEVNYSKTFLNNLINETLDEAKLNGCRMNLYHERDHYMLEVRTYIRSSWLQNDGNVETSLNKLLAYVRITDKGAKFLGTMLDSPLYSEQIKRLLKDWEEYARDFASALNSKLQTVNKPIQEQLGQTFEEACNE